MMKDQQNAERRAEEVCPGKKSQLKLEDVRAQIEQTSGPQYWRSLGSSPEYRQKIRSDYPIRH